jgi:hypothetical protein
VRNEFKLFSRRPVNKSEPLVFELVREAFNPVLGPVEASFGQSEFRDQPPFYLLTRYLKLCRVTGAMEVFRLKHTQTKPILYEAEAEQSPFQLLREDTAGYLIAYLQYAWQRQGYERPEDATWEDDSHILELYWQAEFDRPDSVIILPEYQQVLFWEQMR